MNVYNGDTLHEHIESDNKISMGIKQWP